MNKIIWIVIIIALLVGFDVVSGAKVLSVVQVAGKGLLNVVQAIIA